MAEPKVHDDACEADFSDLGQQESPCRCEERRAAARDQAGAQMILDEREENHRIVTEWFDKEYPEGVEEQGSLSRAIDHVLTMAWLFMDAKKRGAL